MTPTDIDTLLYDLKVAEGLRLTSYRDSVGVLTIGYGCNLEQLTIDAALAERWLSETVTRAATSAERFPWFATVTAPRQRAVVELIYNLGFKGLLGFPKFLAAMANRDYDVAAYELMNSKWASDVGPTRSKRIIAQVQHG